MEMNELFEEILRESKVELQEKKEWFEDRDSWTFQELFDAAFDYVCEGHTDKKEIRKYMRTNFPGGRGINTIMEDLTNYFRDLGDHFGERY